MRLPAWAVVCLLLFTAGADADDALDRLRARGELLVSVKNDAARGGEGHRDPAHVAKRRFEVALAEAIAGHLLGSEAKVGLRILRKPERLPAIARGEVDLGIAMFPLRTDPAREVDYSEPYFETGLALLQRDGGTVGQWADLAGLRIARVRDHHPDAVDALGAADFPGLTPPVFVDFDNFRSATAALAAGDVDGLLHLAVNLDAWIARHPGAWRRSPALRSERYAVAVARGETALLAAVNAALASLRADGSLARMALAAGLPPHP